MRWTVRLMMAVKRGRFTVADRKLAKDWRTCAVSEVPKTIAPKVFYGDWPEDDILNDLGGEFSFKVEADKVGEAVTVYHRIRERARELRA